MRYLNLLVSWLREKELVELDVRDIDSDRMRSIVEIVSNDGQINAHPSPQL
jgi:hypothetical protein